MFEELMAAASAAAVPSAQVGAFARLENAACAARLSAMARMLAAAYAADGSAEREQWRFDNWSAVCAQIGAAQAITSGVASGLLMDAVALAERLPAVAAVFARGEIAYRLVHQICLRTALVKDPEALRAVDAGVAELVSAGAALSVADAQTGIDALVLIHDPYAVRRTESAARGRRVDVSVDDASGMGYLNATMSVTDIHAVDARADAMARTVCAHDPRTLDERRSAAMGAMGFGWDRLPCTCERAECDATARPPVGGIVIHVVAGQELVDAAADGPAPDPDPAPEPDPHPEPEPASAPTGDLVAQRRALAERPRMLPKPWYSYTWSGLMAALAADRGEFCRARPAVIVGGPVVPAPVLAQAALHARIVMLAHPGQSPPQPRYRPTKALDDFVRCRDQRCRFPGCTRTAIRADADHTVPYPWGPTAASNLVCLCREHHLCKTFWPGWHTRQFPDGTLVWTDPDGHTHTTKPGSRILFGELCVPTAAITTTGRVPPKHTAALTMPRRTSTRAQDRARRIDDERRRNAAWAEQHLRESVPPF